MCSRQAIWGVFQTATNSNLQRRPPRNHPFSLPPFLDTARGALCRQLETP